MARHLAAVLVALALAVASCGGDKGTSSEAASSTTTTTTAATSSTTRAPTTVRIVTAHALAKLVAQIDDQLRGQVAAADPCLHGRNAECTGPALDAFTLIDDLAGAVSVLRESVTKGSTLYAGDLPPDLIGQYDETLNAGATVKEASTQAQAACLPDFPARCGGAVDALNQALIELYKAFNHWRASL